MTVVTRLPMTHFNPRSPHGERRGLNGRMVVAEKFQSTLPARGATKFFSVYYDANKISIHAPRTGSDASVYVGTKIPKISIHAPRTGSDGQQSYEYEKTIFISIHAPRTGSDTVRAMFEKAKRISIHAPRTGSDTRLSSICRILPFQSTLPARGATSNGCGYADNSWNFNPRSPHGERRAQYITNGRAFSISIHAPRTGSDCAK